MNESLQQPSDIRPPDEKLKSISELAPQLRRKIRAVQRNILSDSAKLLYCCLNELMFLDFYSERRGIIKVGQPELAKMLSWSVTKVERKARELESDRRLYRKIVYEGRSQKTLWHIREVVSSQIEFFDDADQSFVRSRVEGRRPLHGANGKFLPKSSSRQICINGETKQNQAVDSIPPSSSRQFRRDSHGNSAVIVTAIPPIPSPQTDHSHNGESAVIVTAIPPIPSRQNGAVHNGNSAVIVTAKLPRKEDVSGQLDSLDTSFKRLTGLNAQNAPGEEKRQAIVTDVRRLASESALLTAVAEMMERFRKGSAKFELKNSGAWWRNAHRINPHLIQVVFDDVNSKVKEGTIKTSPGQTAVDLWGHLGGIACNNKNALAAMNARAVKKAAAATATLNR